MPQRVAQAGSIGKEGSTRVRTSVRSCCTSTGVKFGSTVVTRLRGWLMMEVTRTEKFGSGVLKTPIAVTGVHAGFEMKPVTPACMCYVTCEMPRPACIAGSEGPGGGHAAISILYSSVVQMSEQFAADDHRTGTSHDSKQART